MTIHILRNNQQSGPHEEAALREMIAAGNLDRKDLGWQEGMAEWQPLEKLLPQLFSAAPPPPETQPPKISAPPPQRQIHVTRNGEALGTFPESEITTGLGNGRFVSTDLGWSEGMSGWKPLPKIVEVGGGDGSVSAPGDGRDTCKLVYLLYALSCIPVLWFLNIVGIVLAVMNEDKAPDWIKTHYRYLIRTFWLGLVGGLIGAALTVILIGWLLIISLFVWYIIRIYKGWSYFSEGKAHPDPTTMMF